MRYTEFRKLKEQDPTPAPVNPTPPPMPGGGIMGTPAAQNFKSMQTDLQKAIANLNLKDQASIDILKQLYTVLNKQDIEFHTCYFTKFMLLRGSRCPFAF